MFKLIITFSTLSIVSSISVSAPAEVSARRAAGDMAVEFKNHRYPPAAATTPLPARPVSDNEKYIVEQAERLAKNNPLLSIIMIDRGQVIFEAYNSPAQANRPNFSWSMSKSLVAYTLGIENCETNRIDYDKPASTYSPDLKGTVYGEATVRNLLTMSSGVRKAVTSGDHLAVSSGCTPGIDCDGWQLQRSQRLTGVEYLHRVFERDIPSGKEFRYSGTDTLALANLVEQQGGLIEKFNQHIWSKIGAESAGYWLLDRDNRPIAQAGFSATTRDWARLAMYTVKLHKSGNSCQREFMKAATSPQLPNYGQVGRSFSHYGFQTWITNHNGKPAYWWVGYGGQRVAVDPESEKIMIITSWREDYMPEVYDLFKQWQMSK
jgi:CubicO group peptidase (beta-lactamase class C family)